MKRIAFAGGGVSGGHVATIGAVFQEFQRRSGAGGARARGSAGSGLAYLWIGSRDGRERARAEQLGIPFVVVPVGKLRRYLSVANVVDLFRIPAGVVASVRALRRFRPDALFVSGGYVSLPPAVAAWLLRIPVVIHESDVAPGLANRLVARFARVVCVGSQEARAGFRRLDARGRVVVTGNPMRDELIGGDASQGAALFGFRVDVPTVLVIGGAQGSRLMNEAVIAARAELSAIAQVVHVCGEAHVEELRRLMGGAAARYRLVGFLHSDLRDVLALATIAVTRGSANVLNELAAYGVPSVVVPMEAYASGHQLDNARRVQAHQAGVVVRESELTPEAVVSAVREIVSDGARRAEMSAQARALFVPDAARAICREITRSLTKGKRDGE